MTDELFICSMAQMSYYDKEYIEKCFACKTENDMNLELGMYLSCVPFFFDASETGYCDAQVYICNTQKNELLIACRGTESLSDILIDLKLWRDNLYDIYYHNNFQSIKNTYGIPKIHKGFYEQYHTIKFIINQKISLYLLENACDPVIIFTGHSLGGALSTIGAVCAAIQFKHKNINIQCYTFGSPKVGNSAFVNIFNTFVTKSIRYVNNMDPVPMLPFFGYRHVKGLKHLGGIPCTFPILYSNKTDHYIANYKKELAKTSPPVSRIVKVSSVVKAAGLFLFMRFVFYLYISFTREMVQHRDLLLV